MAAIQTLFIRQEIAYTGEQLHSHWAYRSYDLLGNSAVAFVGPCDVRPEHMKDVEDVKHGSRIYSERMLHFIVEHFGCGLDEAVLRQRLMIAIMGEDLNGHLAKLGHDAGSEARKRKGRLGPSFAEASEGKNSETRKLGSRQIARQGSDLYDGKYKLTVSIASVSAVSALIHAGINVSSRNTPVPTRGLADYGIEPRAFAEEILAGYAAECEGLLRARCKVRACE